MKPHPLRWRHQGECVTEALLRLRRCIKVASDLGPRTINRATSHLVSFFNVLNHTRVMLHWDNSSLSRKCWRVNLNTDGQLKGQTWNIRNIPLKHCCSAIRNAVTLHHRNISSYYFTRPWRQYHLLYYERIRCSLEINYISTSSKQETVMTPANSSRPASYYFNLLFLHFHLNAAQNQNILNENEPSCWMMDTWNKSWLSALYSYREDKSFSLYIEKLKRRWADVYYSVDVNCDVSIYLPWTFYFVI